MSEPCSDLCTYDSKKLWEKGIVPYEFDNGVSENLIHSVESAMKEISNSSSARFVKRTDQFDYVGIVDKSDYWSYVGKQGGKQELSVTEGWPHPVGSAIHELMHALGFYHEHCRPDRDRYLIVKKSDNINYMKIEASKAICFGLYDPESIMHYPPGQNLQVKPETKGVNAMGQREMLSKGDVKALKMLYPPLSALSTLNYQKVRVTISKERIERQYNSRMKLRMIWRKRNYRVMMRKRNKNKKRMISNKGCL